METGCGHCKKAKPEYQNAAAEFADDKKIAFAAMDCTTNRNTCQDLDVKGYPTFYYFSYGKGEEKYQRGRTVSLGSVSKLETVERRVV